MSMSQMRHCLAMVVAAGLLAACSGQPAPTPAQKAAAQEKASEAASQQKLELFHKLLKMQQPQLAVQIGEEILHKYPHTAAAREMTEKLPKLKAAAAAQTEKKRLANLWLYQVSPMAGGTQSTATIHNSEPGNIKANLILRRHSEWGTSVYLYADQEKGFVCHGECKVAVQFDGSTHVFHAVTPDGGRPALMFRHQKDFIHLLEKADKVSIPVTIQGKGKLTLVYETGGFQPDKWKPLDKK